MFAERALSHLSAGTSASEALLPHRARHSRHLNRVSRGVCRSSERILFSTLPQHPCIQPTGDDAKVVTQFVAETQLPTRHGVFRLRGYKHSVNGGALYTEPSAAICGDVFGCEDLPVRVHDACFTSEVLGSLKCDCAEQLQLALEHFQREPPGVLIYLQQEGRGIGLANKIAAYALQEKGLDTVDANRALGLPDDCREYSSVKNILDDLGVRSIRLMTNNPRKMKELEALGVKVTGRMPCLVQAGQHNSMYLEAKRDRMDHMLEDGVNGGWCYWNHEPAALLDPLASPVCLQE